MTGPVSGFMPVLSRLGNWNRWALFVSAAREMPSGQAHVDTVVEGANFQSRGRSGLDFAVRHSRVEGVMEHQLQFGMTINLGSVR
ncbi:MAG: hypothetical protein EXQ52_11710 [Bryobacterales bacterium]|nr:hypothetical protein [Bryobacterales bacterium]